MANDRLKRREKREERREKREERREKSILAALSGEVSVLTGGYYMHPLPDQPETECLSLNSNVHCNQQNR